MAFVKEITGDELYLYMNGKLIYKKWLKTGQSKVFDVMAYDKYTLVSITDSIKPDDSEKCPFGKMPILKNSTEWAFYRTL